MLLFKKAIVKYYIKKNFFSREIYTHISHSTLVYTPTFIIRLGLPQTLYDFSATNLIRFLKRKKLKEKKE
tara:strand:+ start:503 stop:712 length:210 start_codon:yes stop_codon:yes gene_type:complete